MFSTELLNSKDRALRNGLMDEPNDGPTDGQTDARTDRQTDGPIHLDGTDGSEKT